MCHDKMPDLAVGKAPCQVSPCMKQSGILHERVWRFFSALSAWPGHMIGVQVGGWRFSAPERSKFKGESRAAFGPDDHHFKGSSGPDSSFSSS